MQAPTSVCSLFENEFDKEDIVYLKESFCSLISGTSHSTLSLSFNLKSESVLSSPFRLANNQKFSGDRNISSSNYQRINGFKTSTSKKDKSLLRDSTIMYNEIIRNGIDQEDVEFIKKSFQSLLWDENERYWTSKVSWDEHPPTADSFINCVKEDSDVPLNKSGSARTEGYFKVNKLLLLKRKALLKKSEASDSSQFSMMPYSKNYRGNKQNLSRDARNNQRRLSTAFQTITQSDLLNLNELKFRKKKLRLGKSEIHGLGIFACEPIAPNEIIIEYVGQIIRHIIADMREEMYKKSGIGSYCFRVDDDIIIDSTKYGNLNRYINHSCNPNSYSKILVINNQKKIVIYSKKSISIGEEITYDYKMPYEDDKIVCLCNVPGCRKSLN